MLQGPELRCRPEPPGQTEAATSEFWKLPPAQSHTQLSVGAQLQPFRVVGALEEKNVLSLLQTALHLVSLIWWEQLDEPECR